MSPPPAPRSHSAIFNAAFAAVFVGALFIPGIATIWYRDEEDVGLQWNLKKVTEALRFEKEALCEKFPEAFEDLINNHFAFRRDLIDLNARAIFAVFGESASDSVVVGRDGWLFYANEGRLDDFRGLVRQTPDELELWTTALEVRRDDLAERGIPYLFVIAPNKQSIYPDKIPKRFNRVNPDTQFDTLLAHLKSKNSKVEILDLRESQRIARKKGTTYYPLDTHWNQFGAYYGYRALMKKLDEFFPGIGVLPPERLTWERHTRDDFDLPRLMGLRKRMGPGSNYLSIRDSTADFPSERPPDAPELKTVTYGEGSLQRYRISRSPGQKPRAIVLHDSFALSMLPPMAEHFSEMVAIWAPFETDILEEAVEKFQPDIVIEERLDRMLQNTPLYDPAISTRRFRSVFENAGDARFTLEGENAAERFDKRREIDVSAQVDGTRLRVKGSDARIDLPRIPVKRGESVVCKWAVSLQRRATVRIQWLMPSMSKEDKKLKTRIELPAGESEFYLALPDSTQDGEFLIRFRPDMEQESRDSHSEHRGPSDLRTRTASLSTH